MTSGIEQRHCIVTVNRRVVIADLQVEVYEAHSFIWDEHALVPIALGGTVRDCINGYNNCCR